jgi:hypothetical protein
LATIGDAKGIKRTGNEVASLLVSPPAKNDHVDLNATSFFLRPKIQGKTMKIYCIETSVVSSLLATILLNKDYTRHPIYEYFENANLVGVVELKISALYIKGLLHEEFNKKVDNLAQEFYRECLDLVDFEVVAGMIYETWKIDNEV